VSVSRAETLLAQAAAERVRLRRHLLVAAALREVLCGWVTAEERRVLRALGFRRRGRHWFDDASKVAVEFPDSLIEGDEGRVERVKVSSGTAAIIGVDDLYLDRLRQATTQTSEESIEFRSALAVPAGALEPWRGAGLRDLLRAKARALRVVERLGADDTRVLLGRLRGGDHDLGAVLHLRAHVRHRETPADEVSAVSGRHLADRSAFCAHGVSGRRDEVHALQREPD